MKLLFAVTVLASCTDSTRPGETINHLAFAFQPSVWSARHNANVVSSRQRLWAKDSGGGAGDGTIDLKAELTEYLKKREEVGADEAAQK